MYNITIPVNRFFSLSGIDKIFLHKDGVSVGIFKPKDRKTYKYLGAARKRAVVMAEEIGGAEVVKISKNGRPVKVVDSYIGSHIIEGLFE